MYVSPATNYDVILNVTGTGNVGIGTTAPEGALDIIGPQQGIVTTLGSEVPGLILQQRHSSTDGGLVYGPMLEFRVNNGTPGNVWTTSAIVGRPASAFGGDLAFFTVPISGSTDPAGRRTASNSALIERMRIQADGKVGIGLTPTHLIHLNGGAYCDGTGDWITGSDIAYKENIDYDFKYGLREIEQLKPVYYVHKQDKENKKQIGFIAQDMLEVIPEVVSGTEGALGLSYGQLTAVLVKAVQEQQVRIEELKARIEVLEAKQLQRVPMRVKECNQTPIFCLADVLFRYPTLTG